MTHIIIALDGSTYIHKDSQKSPDELCREVKLGSFEYPIPMKDPTAVRLQNYLLIAERDQNPLLNTNQLILLDLLCQGATDKQMQQAMQLSQGGIRYHMESLMQKFNVGTKEELISVYSRRYR